MLYFILIELINTVLLLLVKLMSFSNMLWIVYERAVSVLSWKLIRMEMCSLFHKFGVASLIPTASIRCKKGGVNNNSIARATTTVLKNHIGTTPRVLKLISTDKKMLKKRISSGCWIKQKSISDATAALEESFLHLESPHLKNPTLKHTELGSKLFESSIFFKNGL